MKLTRICLITTALMSSLNIMASSTQNIGQPTRYSIMFTNNPSILPPIWQKSWSLYVSPSDHFQKITCNGGQCPTTISPGQTISIEASMSQQQLGPIQFGITATSPSYIAHGLTCNYIYSYLIISPNNDMNAVLPLSIGRGAPNPSSVQTEESCHSN